MDRRESTENNNFDLIFRNIESFSSEREDYSKLLHARYEEIYPRLGEKYLGLRIDFDHLDSNRGANISFCTLSDLGSAAIIETVDGPKVVAFPNFPVIASRVVEADVYYNSVYYAILDIPENFDMESLQGFPIVVDNLTEKDLQNSSFKKIELINAAQQLQNELDGSNEEINNTVGLIKDEFETLRNLLKYQESLNYPGGPEISIENIAEYIDEKMIRISELIGHLSDLDITPDRLDYNLKELSVGMEGLGIDLVLNALKLKSAEEVIFSSISGCPGAGKGNTAGAVASTFEDFSFPDGSVTGNMENISALQPDRKVKIVTGTGGMMYRPESPYNITQEIASAATAIAVGKGELVNDSFTNLMYSLWLARQIMHTKTDSTVYVDSDLYPRSPKQRAFMQKLQEKLVKNGIQSKNDHFEVRLIPEDEIINYDTDAYREAAGILYILANGGDNPDFESDVNDKILNIDHYAKYHYAVKVLLGEYEEAKKRVISRDKRAEEKRDDSAAFLRRMVEFWGKTMLIGDNTTLRISGINKDPGNVVQEVLFAKYGIFGLKNIEDEQHRKIMRRLIGKAMKEARLEAGFEKGSPKPKMTSKSFGYLIEQIARRKS